MKCPKCSSDNFEVISKSGKINNASILDRLGRLCLVVCTCGIWLLVPKKAGKIQSKTVFVCKNCGNEFNAKQGNK